MKSTYVLIVDKAWAKLYKTGVSPTALALVYHQALFGGRPVTSDADAELARSLCRILRADRQMGKYTQIIMIASAAMLTALCRQYDGDAREVITGRIEDLPAKYGDADVLERVNRLLVHADPAQEAQSRAAH
ncbi:MAG: hypothetical protein RLZZ227_2890 [Pseudomonadota bacterium]|jgi:hypothetical protein